MTLREIFNAILDHPIQFEFEFDPWGVAVGAYIAIVILLLVYVVIPTIRR